MKENRDTRLEQLLDLLAEEVAERLRASSRLDSVPFEEERLTDEGARLSEAPEPPSTPSEPEAGAEGTVQPEYEEWDAEAMAEPTPVPAPAAPAPTHTARLIGRLALGLLALVVVINIPINRHGTTLATAMPDRRALVIRDGLVVKEADDLEIYVYQDGQFRWITSMRAFEMRGYVWDDVHIVEDGFLEDYEIGPPVHVILKCPDSPHIYRLEGEEKRWIVDIEAFEAEGYVWEDVQFVSCSYLRGLPDGETIPPGQGPPPQP